MLRRMACRVTCTTPDELRVAGRRPVQHRRRVLLRPGVPPLVRSRVVAGFRSIVSGDPNGTPPWVQELAHGDDAGYFGPGSAVWAVHADVATLVGGVRALLLQTLHPAAITGVDQHSTYRQDPLARLAGTSRWLTVTAFGDRAAADREAARVRGMHRQVKGTYRAADGVERGYRAGDDRLLSWVHATFTDSFVVAQQVFGAPIPGGPDRYVEEWATAGRLVGVSAPPRSVCELDELITGFTPELARTEAALRTLDFLRRPPLPPAAQVGYAVLFAAAASTLRPEHRVLLGLDASGIRAPRAAARALLGGLRRLLADGPPALAAARDRVERLDRLGPSPSRVALRGAPPGEVLPLLARP
jgi:uncharacterized protein (DUF2236 family)